MGMHVYDRICMCAHTRTHAYIPYPMPWRVNMAHIVYNSPKHAQKYFQDVIGGVSFIISRVSSFSIFWGVINIVKQPGAQSHSAGAMAKNFPRWNSSRRHTPFRWPAAPATLIDVPPGWLPTIAIFGKSHPSRIESRVQLKVVRLSNWKL